MARDESNREDLLREATALVERIELIPNGMLAGERIIAGFRRNGALSIFFGEDPVYQFNVAGELRRAFCDGKLLKAMDGRLVALERLRTEHETQLIRHELNRSEETALLARMSERLRELAASLAANGFEVAGQVPDNLDVIGRLRTWFLAHEQWQIAVRPNA